MRRSFTRSFPVLVLIFSLHTAKPQQVFIDSIHSMLTDLNSNIQYAPINELLQHALPFCTGSYMNDSLTSCLKQLISEDYIFLEGLQQAVSPHLVKNYVPFILRLSEYIAKHDTAGSYNENMMRVAFVMTKAGREKEGHAFNKRARDILLALKQDELYFNAKRSYYLAQTYFDGYKPDSCYILYKQSLLQNPNRNEEENILFAKALYSFAGYCYGHNKRDTSLFLFLQLLDIRKKIHGDSSSDYAYWLIVIADQYTYQSKYRQAQEMNFKALEITRNTIGENTNQYALCLNDIGEVYYRTGEYDKALPFAQQSLAIKRKIFGNEYFDNVVSLHNLATLYTRMGLYNEAIPLLEESLAISKKYFGEKLVYAFDLHPLAEVYTYLGEYDKALPLYQKSQQIQKKLLHEEGGNENNIYYPGVLHSIAVLYTKLVQYDKAIELFNHALEIKKEVYGEMNPEYAKTLNSYAEACLLQGNYKKALELQLRSLSLARKLFGDAHPNIAAGLYNLAKIYYEQSNMQKAQELCNQALVMQIKIFGRRHQDVAASLDMLGNINKKTNRDKIALQYYDQAFEIRKKIMAATHPAYINSLYNLGNINIKRGEVHKASQLYIEADSCSLLHLQQSYISLSEEEKLIYLHNAEKQFHYLPSILYTHKSNSPSIANRVYTNMLALKSMVLFNQQQVYNSIRKSNDSVSLQLYNLWRFNKEVIGKQLLLPGANRRPGFDSLQDATTQMEEQLSRISASFRNISFYNAIGMEDVQQRLAKDEAAIEFIRFRLFKSEWTDSVIYAALVLLPGKKNVVFVPLCEEKQLKNLLRYSNNSGEAAVTYLYPAGGNETQSSKALNNLVWQPLQSLLTGIRTVYYSPSGLLCKLSFAAIHSDNAKLLADKYDLKQMLSTRSIVINDEIDNNFTTASLWGSIDYENAEFAGTSGKDSSGQAWKSLPGTKAEIESIAVLLNERNIVCKKEGEGQANEVQFKKMDGRSASILHVATHGFFLPPTSALMTGSNEHNSFSVQQSPMFRSGLLLAGSNATWRGNVHHENKEDGVLTAYEIAHLDLSNTRLAVLSACETALGGIEDNEGVYGLQRAFKIAGVKHLLMSLWAVPDKETTELMLCFYDFLLQGNDANKALKYAQLAMKSKYSPYYWAGFILTE